MYMYMYIHLGISFLHDPVEPSYTQCKDKADIYQEKLLFKYMYIPHMDKYHNGGPTYRYRGTHIQWLGRCLVYM